VPLWFNYANIIKNGSPESGNIFYFCPMHRIFCSFLLLLTITAARAQERWSLQQCVSYALTNNISVKQADVQQRLSALQLKLYEAARIPNLNFSTSGGYNFGRSINPASNVYVNNNIGFLSFQLQSDVTLFNWFSVKRQVEAGRLDLKAAEAGIDKAKNDIAINVAVAYLQALLSSETVEISRVQIQQTAAQLENTRKRVKAGALPELNAIEIEAQLSSDSAAYTINRATYDQTLILLKALLNLDMAIPFDIEKPDISSIPVETLADLQPSFVYNEALKNMPLQRVNQFRYEAAQKTIAATRAAMYPRLSAFASIGSQYSSQYPDQQHITRTPTGTFDTVGIYVETSPGNFQPALSPGYVTTIPNVPFNRQLFNLALGQAVGLNLSVPLFNGRQQRTAWDRAKLNAENIKLQLEQDNKTLQNDIYTAYTNAVNAQQNYLASVKLVERWQTALSFSEKRYNAGLLSTFELITNRNSLFRAQLDALRYQYEYVFRMKLLEFYKGQGIKL